jgi:hypothetical protein
MPFAKGHSGNPAGRPPGTRNKSTILLQSLLEGDGEKIAKKAIQMAKDGDRAAMRICMDRLVPLRKHDPVTCELPPLDKAADTVAAMATIARAVAAGDLTPSEAGQMAKVVDVYVRALAANEFDDRLTALESTASAFANRGPGAGGT